MRIDLIEQLYNDCYRDVFAYIFSLCADKELTEDIVNQGFEKAIVTLDDNVPNFKFWLMRVCKNLLIDIKRRDKFIAKEPYASHVLTSNYNVEDEVINNIELAKLHEAIKRLNDKEREIISLFYFSNMNIKEIALFMSASTANIKVILHRSRLKLKGYMEDSK